MAPCSYQCHTEEGRSHCSFSNSFGTRVSMGLATAPRTHVTNSVLHCTATSPETLKKWDETKIRRCSLQEVLMNKRQCELQKVTETPRPSVRRVPCSCSCLSVCLSIYLFIYLSIRLSLCLPAWLSSNLSVYLSICISASLKTKLFCETSSLFALDNIKNAAILQDFFNVLT